MKRKQTKPSKTPQIESVMGVAWYRPEQWQRLLEVATDRESLHDTYTEWVVEASIRFEELQKMGYRVKKVEVDVEEIVQWCQAQQRKVDGEARSMFVAEKTSQLDQLRGKKKGGYV